MPRIFISYRRDDTEMAAGRLAGDLRNHFGDVVFRDKESIPVGADWMQEINRAIGPGGVVLVLIGEQWLEDKPPGERRIDQADDPHRNEIAAALRLKAHVLPLLVRHARMPARESLPEPLQRLAAINAMKLRDDEWADYDFPRLANALEGLGFKPVKPRPEPAATRLSAKVIAGLILTGLVLMAYVGELEGDAYAGGLAVALAGVALAAWGWLDVRAQRAKGHVAAVVAMVTGVLVSLALIGDMMDAGEFERDFDGDIAGFDTRLDSMMDGAPPAAGLPSLPRPDSAALAPSAAPAPQRMTPPQAVVPAPAPRAAAPLSLTGIWVDQSDGLRIEMRQDGATVTAAVFSGGMLLNGFGTLSGGRLEIIWGAGGVPMASSTLTLSPNGRQLSGPSMAISGDTDWTVLVRE